MKNVDQILLEKAYQKILESYWYKGMNPTVDNVILKRTGKGLEVLLIKRKSDTEGGKWALPGGFILRTE